MWWLCTAPCSSHSFSLVIYFQANKSFATEMIFPLGMVHRHVGFEADREAGKAEAGHEGTWQLPICLLNPSLHSTPAPCWDPRANPMLHCHLPQLLNMQIPRKQEQTPRKEHPNTQNIKTKLKHTTYQMISYCCNSPKHRSRKESSPCGVCFE